MIDVEVVFSPAPGEVLVLPLRLPDASTVSDALQAAHIFERFPQLNDGDLSCGIWGRRQPLATPLRDRDRVEVYRPLKVDPKEARRQRYKGQATPRGRRRA